MAEIFITAWSSSGMYVTGQRAMIPEFCAPTTQIADTNVRSLCTTENPRKMDFGVRTNGPDNMPLESNTSDFCTVEVVAEHAPLNRTLPSRSGSNLSR